MTDQPPAQPGVPAIEMTGVAVGSLRDPDTVVAEGINWTVSAGDYWVVAGLHGSGKSDLGSGLARAYGERRAQWHAAPAAVRLHAQHLVDLGAASSKLTAQPAR